MSVLCNKIVRMTITIETIGIREIEQLLQVLKSLNIKNITIKEGASKQPPVISKGDKNLDPRACLAFGKHRELDQVREEAWKRNWNI